MNPNIGAEIVSRWNFAGQTLAENEKAKVACPVCRKAILVVIDVRSETTPEFVERMLVCPLCRVKNSLRLIRPCD